MLVDNIDDTGVGLICAYPSRDLLALSYIYYANYATEPRLTRSWSVPSVLNGSGRPSLAPGRPRPDPEGQVKYGSGQRGPAVGQAGGRERWRFFRPPLTWADLGPALDPEIRKKVVNLQKITLKPSIS